MAMQEVIAPLPITIADAGAGQALVRDATGRFRNHRLDTWDVAWSGASAYADGTAYASMSDSSAAIIAAIAQAKALGVKVAGAGRFRVDSRVDITDVDADFSAATFVCNDADLDPLIRVGPITGGSNGVTARREIMLPRVENAAYVFGNGWGGNSSCGIEIANCFSNSIRIPYVDGFGTGVRLKGYGTGCVHNRIELGQFRANLVQLHLTADSTGWTNSNTFWQGNFEHPVAEPDNLSGARHILIDATTEIINNNLFINPALEGDTPEYHYECHGEYNLILMGRWEANPPKALFDGAGCRGNVIGWGVGTYNIVRTYANGAQRVPVYGMGSDTTLESAGGRGTLSLQNNTTEGPVLHVLSENEDPGATAATVYRVEMTCADTRYKRKTDTAPRFHIDHDEGRLYFGGGSAAVDVMLRRGASDRLGLGPGDAWQVGAVSALPTPAVGYRGYELRVEGGTGVADGKYICLKKADETYRWFNVLTGAEV